MAVGAARVVRTAAGVLAGAMLAWAAPPEAPAGELYRCPAPDGSLRFTDDPAACPGARPHAPRRDVQRFATPPPARRVRRAPPAASAAPPGAGTEAAWRQRLAAARTEHERLSAEAERLDRATSWCNRGGLLLRKDRSGLNRTVRCQDVRAERERTHAELERVRALLEGGLEEECRRAGCLPGWLR